MGTRRPRCGARRRYLHGRNRQRQIGDLLESLMRARTTRHQRYSDSCGGELTVYVTPLDRFDHYGKSAVDIGVTTPDGRVWAPKEPLWLSPLYDADSKDGRRESADAA